MDWTTITHPTLLLDEDKARLNIDRMVRKASSQSAAFRPHFKTHQSADIGQWFRDYNVSRIAVSSAQMAVYFASRGWKDILVSFPFHPQQWPILQPLANAITLGVAVSNLSGATAIAQLADTPLQVWIEIDLGQGRTGFTPHAADVEKAVAVLQTNKHLDIRGFHVHAGQSYACRGREALLALGDSLLPLIKQLQRDWLHPRGWQLSFGDTPLCSVLADLSFADELRPGNFIFYDLMQWQIGACQPEDIAVAVACPVIDAHFLYGGAVHFSKDAISIEDRLIYGLVANPSYDGWDCRESILSHPIIRLSQEHGWLDRSAPPLKYGSIVPVLPVHSCLAVEALPYYRTTTGQRIDKFSVKMYP